MFKQKLETAYSDGLWIRLPGFQTQLRGLAPLWPLASALC